MKPTEFSQFTTALKTLFDNPIAQDTEQHVKTLFQKQVEKMGFVSRDEFDIQQRVLARSRAKLEQLEQKLNELEQG